MHRLFKVKSEKRRKCSRIFSLHTRCLSHSFFFRSRHDVAHKTIRLGQMRSLHWGRRRIRAQSQPNPFPLSTPVCGLSAVDENKEQNETHLKWRNETIVYIRVWMLLEVAAKERCVRVPASSQKIENK